jgi:ABC-type transport system involved in multi-copper enzyme maturation permease subunit
MSAQAEVLITAEREIRKNLRSAKGIAMFALFVIGGLIPRLLDLLAQRYAKDMGVTIPPDEVLQQAKVDLFTKQFGEAGGKYLADCPMMLYWLFQGTLTFLPLVILMVGFDTIAGETQHRTLRYMTPRANRASIAIGKALGVWGVAALMIFVLHATTWVLTLIEGKTGTGLVFSWGLRLWAFAAVYAAAYVGITTLLSSVFKIPVVALFAGVGVWAVMGIMRFGFSFSEKLQAATWAFPASYDKWLLSPDPTYVAGAIAVLLAWGATCVILATEILRRKDV